MAGSGELRVLVPKYVGEDAAATHGDSLDALARTIDREVRAARSAKPRAPLVIYADTTIDYGCLCPPFVFAPFTTGSHEVPPRAGYRTLSSR